MWLFFRFVSIIYQEIENLMNVGKGEQFVGSRTLSLLLT